MIEQIEYRVAIAHPSLYNYPIQSSEATYAPGVHQEIMSYVMTFRSEQGVRKWQFLLSFSTEHNQKGEMRGGQITPTHDPLGF